MCGADFHTISRCTSHVVGPETWKRQMARFAAVLSQPRTSALPSRRSAQSCANRQAISRASPPLILTVPGGPLPAAAAGTSASAASTATALREGAIPMWYRGRRMVGLPS